MMPCMELNSPPLERLDHTRQQLPRHNFLHTPQECFPSGHGFLPANSADAKLNYPWASSPLSTRHFMR